MKAIYLGICALALGIGACENEVPSTSETAAPSFPASAAGDSSSAAAPVNAGDAAASDPAGAVVPAGINPPHGQPGHTCDIPVGQPLNSKPTTGAAAPSSDPITVGQPPAGGVPVNVGTPPISGAPQGGGTVIGTKPQTGTATAGVRLNPPHGQPGHSCDVKVGDPL